MYKCNNLKISALVLILSTICYDLYYILLYHYFFETQKQYTFLILILPKTINSILIVFGIFKNKYIYFTGLFLQILLNAYFIISNILNNYIDSYILSDLLFSFILIFVILTSIFTVKTLTFVGVMIFFTHLLVCLNIITNDIPLIYYMGDWILILFDFYIIAEFLVFWSFFLNNEKNKTFIKNFLTKIIKFYKQKND